MTDITNNYPPKIVAHRGYAERYPENSIAACEAALLAGVQYIEIDIQLTADHIAYLLHDENLLRTVGCDIMITDIDSTQLESIVIKPNSPQAKNIQFTRPPKLEEYVELMLHWPNAYTFIEIKTESIEIYGHALVSQVILDVLKPILNRCALISYNLDFLHSIKNLILTEKIKMPIGWILTHYDIHHYDKACELGPAFLICNYQKIDNQPLWSGAWQWVLYEIKDADLAIQLYQKGADLIETMAIENLLQDPRINTLNRHNTHDNDHDIF